MSYQLLFCPDFYIPLSLFVGLFVGSFLCVCADRYLTHESPVNERSHCTACGKKLSWLELIPVVSWLLQHGRCRKCHEPVSWRYPVMEIVSGVIFACVTYKYGLCRESAWMIFFCCVFMVISSIDVRACIIPDRMIYPAILLALLHVFFLPDFWQRLLGAGIAAGCFLATSVSYKIFRGKHGMGFGDIKLVFCLCLLSKFCMVPLFLFLAAVSGVLFILLLLFFTRESVSAFDPEFDIRSIAIPFGPFLCAAWFLVTLFASDIFRTLS